MNRGPSVGVNLPYNLFPFLIHSEPLSVQATSIIHSECPIEDLISEDSLGVDLGIYGPADFELLIGRQLVLLGFLRNDGNVVFYGLALIDVLQVDTGQANRVLHVLAVVQPDSLVNHIPESEEVPVDIVEVYVVLDLVNQQGDPPESLVEVVVVPEVS